MVTLNMKGKEFKQFIDFLYNKKQSSPPHDRSSIQLGDYWKEFCKQQAYMQMLEREEEAFERGRKCYGDYDDANSMCTDECPYSERCEYDAKDYYQPCNKCVRTREVGYKRCLYHIRYYKNYTRRMYRTRVRFHLCSKCGTRMPDEWPHTRCQTCHEALLKRAREDYRAKKESQSQNEADVEGG